MNITFKLSVFDYRIATFTVRLDIDQDPTSVAAPVVKNVVKGFSRGWFKRMVS